MTTTTRAVAYRDNKRVRRGIGSKWQLVVWTLGNFLFLVSLTHITNLYIYLYLDTVLRWKYTAKHIHHPSKQPKTAQSHPPPPKMAKTAHYHPPPPNTAQNGSHHTENVSTWQKGGRDGENGLKRHDGKWAAMTKTSPNDASGVVWAIGKLFSCFFYTN